MSSKTFTLTHTTRKSVENQRDATLTLTGTPAEEILRVGRLVMFTVKPILTRTKRTANSQLTVRVRHMHDW